MVELGLHQGTAVEIQDDEFNDNYGPGTEVDNQEASKVLPVVGLFLRDGLYLSHGHISVYRYLESKKIKPMVQGCIGYSCLVASLYAKYQNASQVEWKSFALWQKLKDEKPHSSKWKKIISDFNEKEFGEMRIEELSGVVSFYMWNKEKSKVFSLNRGRLVWALEKSLFLDNSEKWESAIASTYIVKASDLKNNGAELVLDVTITPVGAILEGHDSFLTGLYGRQIGLNRRNKGDLEFKLELPLDESKNFTHIITATQKEIKQNSQSLDEFFGKFLSENKN